MIEKSFFADKKKCAFVSERKEEKEKNDNYRREVKKVQRICVVTCYWLAPWHLCFFFTRIFLDGAWRMINWDLGAILVGIFALSCDAITPIILLIYASSILKINKFTSLLRKKKGKFIILIILFLFLSSSFVYKPNENFVKILIFLFLYVPNRL